MFYPAFIADRSATVPLSVSLFQNRIRSHKYRTLDHLENDVMELCQNAQSFNMEGSVVSILSVSCIRSRFVLGWSDTRTVCPTIPISCVTLMSLPRALRSIGGGQLSVQHPPTTTSSRKLKPTERMPSTPTLQHHTDSTTTVFSYALWRPRPPAVGV